MKTLNNQIRRGQAIFFLAVLIIVQTGCKKFVVVDPPLTAIAASTIYSNNTSAAAAMTSIYTNVMTLGGFFSPGGNNSTTIGYYEGLAADELKNYSTNQLVSQFYQNALASNTNGNTNNYFWQGLYQQIYVANAVLEGLANSPGVTAAIKQQLSGEAKFMRAFLYFYAVNLYGDVPLVTTTNYQVNNTVQRTSKAQVYAQIIADLKDAQGLLSSSFVDAYGNTTPERTRPNKGAATALLSRVYLYTGDWADAATQSSLLINNTGNYGLVADLKSVYLANSNEAIWQLQPVMPGYNTFEEPVYVLTSSPGRGQTYVAISPYLLSAFEPGDSRISNWLGMFTSGSTTYYFPYKYKVYLRNQPVTEYEMVFRLAEQYLIRAEAEANGAGGGLSAATADMNMIRGRAGLPNYTGATDQHSVLAAILHERQVELFTEWGHRWFDLIRTGNINTVMGPPGNVCQAKNGNWNPDWELLPLPLRETQINQNLTQNPGY